MGWQYTTGELARILAAPAPAQDIAFSSVATDTRTLKPGQLFFALSGEHFDANRFVPEALGKGAAAAVTSSPGQGPRILVTNPLKALQTFAAAHRQRYPIPVLALTGSCGKTTAKDFAAALLATRYNVVKTQGNLNNDIGCPLSLLRIDGDTERTVIEMGANHVGEIAALCALTRPTESAVTMVAPAHLEGFGTLERVAEAKGEIAEGLDANGCFYVNNDNPWCVRIGERFAGQKVFFGTAGDVTLTACAFDDAGEMLLDIKPVGRLRLPLHVRALTVNVLLAIAVGLRHGIDLFEEPLRDACRSASRCRILRIGPLEVLDDSYNANPASMEAALETLAERARFNRSAARMAALGEMLELGEAAPALHRQLGEQAARHGVTHLFARGPNAREIVAAARAAGVSQAEAIHEHRLIAEAIHAHAQPGDTLLVKGSRGMKMECVPHALHALYAQTTDELSQDGTHPQDAKATPGTLFSG